MNGPSNGDSSQDRTVPDRRAAARQPQAQHGRERVDDQRLLAPVADTACQRLGQAEAALTFLRRTAGG